jgi:hypothetical protein
MYQVHCIKYNVKSTIKLIHNTVYIILNTAYIILNTIYIVHKKSSFDFEGAFFIEIPNS